MWQAALIAVLLTGCQQPRPTPPPPRPTITKPLYNGPASSACPLLSAEPTFLCSPRPLPDA